VLRPGRQGLFRRLTVAGVLVATLLLAPSAGSVPGDPTPPVITPTIVGTLGAAGWYRSNVTVNWSVTDPESIILWESGCEAITLPADTSGTQLVCSAGSDGGTSTVSKTFKIDKTVPTVGAAPDRNPDANGWYNHPVGVEFHGLDATSGIQSCSTAGYSGPDSGAAAVAGSCSDVAGNSAATSFPLKYDATPPTISGLSATVGNRSADISWRRSSDAGLIEVVRAPGRDGQGETLVYAGSQSGFHDTGLAVGRKYEYRVMAVDGAANRAESKLELTATGALFSPLPGAVVSGRPTLVWAPVARAAYYNVQLVRGKRVFSAWPTRTSFRLPRTWTYKGRRHRLRPGLYRWYVWPGFGRISKARYGPLLGGSTFVVAE
jgi:hypothetical protein